MKLLLSLVCLFSLMSFNSYADDIDDLFGRSDNDQEFEFERFDENRIMEAIAHDAGIVCKKGLCTISAVSTKYREVTFNVNGGMGNNASGGFGGYGEGNGTTVNLNTGDSNNNRTVPFEDRLHVGINMQLKIGGCETQVKIPRALYYSINRYLYGLLNSDGSTRRSFTPADQAMIIFYTTVSKQASSCR